MNVPIAGKKLFTPGPLGCSRTVKEAMLTDVGSRDTDFIKTIRAIRSKLIDIAATTPGLRSSKYVRVQQFAYHKAGTSQRLFKTPSQTWSHQFPWGSPFDHVARGWHFIPPNSMQLVVQSYFRTESNTVCLSLGISHEEYTSVLLQGSGTFSVEAVLQLSSPRNGARVLLLVNGAYGNRMKVICDTSGIPAEVLEFPEDNIVDPDTVSRHLSTPGAEYTTVAVVHCETSSGVINPVEEIGRVVKRLAPDAIYFVDAMSSFGAVPLDVKGGRLDFLVSSANKCLQGVPGFAFVIASKAALAASKGEESDGGVTIV
uniref:Aminotransferase class V domain-containing protein n=1 Tax=Timema bartmani TaxID=61472 RepID=A0A7R9I3Q0_9NEOP|nr:unnamed protein product [Timema bartmani]